MILSILYARLWSGFKRLFHFIQSWFPEAPISFPNSGFEIIPVHDLTEEEAHDDFYFGVFYPAQIGEVLQSQYQIVGKLGIGTTSTNWLARDLRWRRFVALKIFTRRNDGRAEYNRMKAIQSHGYKHDGCLLMRDALELITLPRPGGNHHCLVQTPLGQSLQDIQDIQMLQGTGKVDIKALKFMLQRLFWALEYLHNHCHLVHTDIKLDNILQTIEDDSIFDAYVQEELNNPSSRKTVGDRTIYRSRFFHTAFTGNIKLCDFGSAVNGDRKRNHSAQPVYFRAPEVILGTYWSYPVDIWSVGMMVWQMVEGKLLFMGEDPLSGGYSTYGHLFEMVTMLGPPPQDFLERAPKSNMYFQPDGMLRFWEYTAHTTCLAECTNFPDGEEKEMFVAFLGSMIQWCPENRKTASELLRDPWLYT